MFLCIFAKVLSSEEFDHSLKANCAKIQILRVNRESLRKNVHAKNSNVRYSRTFYQKSRIVNDKSFFAKFIIFSKLLHIHEHSRKWMNF
jgi:hypothetical protein